ncbi:Uma2 family endonuclease [Roseofilum sp. Guam]|uniref:Uma2 family endonuclease n=1 Tax=Roseofilum sp. Guam TaxID=2821502 RepID=UPI001B220ED7|nr:Uma2 family endonuclease [Roseofilum sp. Guam]MBP0028654.1 Uma2 family endonuclease [Roseofilum sp. Guam]
MVQLQSQQVKSPSSDQRIVHPGITWEQFKLLQSGFGDRRNLRLFYTQNTVEILTPGREHEFFSRLIGFLIGLFCLEMGIEFEPLGSTTQEREGTVSAEPDESYCFSTSKPSPDLVIEVIFTSGSPNKLQRYRLLGIPEVWFWEDGVFSLYRLRGENYSQISRSEIPELIDLDIELLTRCVLMAQTSRLEAANEFRRWMKK